MKKYLFTILLSFIFVFSSSAQCCYVNPNPDSLRVTVNAWGLIKTMYVWDMNIKYQTKIKAKSDSIAMVNRFTALSSIFQPLGNYATAAQLSNYQIAGNYATVNQLQGYQPAGSYALSSQLSSYQPVGNYATVSQLTAYQLAGNYQTAGDYVTNVQLSSTLNSYQAAGNYVTQAQWTSGMASVQPAGNYATVSQLAAYQLSGNYATTNQLSGKLDTSYNSIIKAFIASNYQPLGNYALSSQLAAYQPLGSYQAAGSYATTTQLNLKLDTGYNSVIKAYTLATFQPLGNYALSSQLSAYQPLGNYATVSQLLGYQPAGSYATSAQVNAKQDTGQQIKYYNAAGRINQVIKVWADTGYVVTANPMIVNISSAGFTQITSIQCFAKNSGALIANIPIVSEKSHTLTNVTFNIGINSALGLILLAIFTGTTLNVRVEGY